MFPKDLNSTPDFLNKKQWEYFFLIMILKNRSRSQMNKKMYNIS